MKIFDRLFGKNLHRDLPTLPGVYRFFDAEGKLIYVGKAKNLKRRLSQYRNAKRCKAHAKMCKIRGEAKRVEFEVCKNEFEALALEAAIIQDHRPKWNVAGAFHFLYPMIGLCSRDGYLYLCYTLNPDAFEHFKFHGAFRSRERTRDGFFALTELLRLIGHAMPKAKIAKTGLVGTARGYLYGFRQISEGWQTRLEAFLTGDDFGAIEELSLQLLDRPTAVAKRKETEEKLHAIRRFWRHEIQALKSARLAAKWEGYPVSQRDRDFVFIALRSKGEFVPTPRGALETLKEDV
ncbi:MAG: GIY-YIG nuclease family protein [Cryobacterium sp.]|nr:GIY-YIG nuclease family protein [Oligoflexia bacterium]